MPHSTTVASRCQSGFGLLAASHRSFVRSYRGGSRSCSAISPSLVGCGVEPSRRRRRNARRHRADACARSSRQVSARFRRTLAGLINLHPLHSISLQFRRLHFRSIRSDGRKLPRPSKTAVRPKIPEAAMLRISAKTGNMAARLRPAKTTAIARDASHGQDTAIAPRGFARCKTPALTVRSAISAPPPFRKLHCSGQKQPNSLVKPDWSDTTAAGCGQVCRARPCCHRVAAHALRSAVVESEYLAGAGATAPGNATRRNVAGFAAALA